MKGKVLIVDDSPADLLLIKKLVVSLEYDAETAISLEEAESSLKDNRPSAILLDFYLEGGNSIDFIKKYHSQLPIILLTGSENPEIGLQAVKKGAQDFLEKGNISKELIEKSLRYAMERQLLKTRISNAEKMASLGKMSSGIAHEMNTPIQYISDNLYFLENQFKDVLSKLAKISDAAEDLDSQDSRIVLAETLNKIDFNFLNVEVTDAVKQSQDGMTKLANLVKALRNFAVNETNEQKKVDINEIISQAVLKFKNGEGKNIQFSENPDIKLKNIVADEKKIREVIQNIIENSCHELNNKFKEEQKGGLITVSTLQKSQSIEVRVADNGNGIPQEIIDHIFDPFFTTKSFDGCLGQGLAVVFRNVNEILEGNIRVYSEGGSGTELVINIPDQEFK